MKKIRIGYEEYKEFINKDMYYVDKTILMRHIVECGGKVTRFLPVRSVLARRWFSPILNMIYTV